MYATLTVRQVYVTEVTLLLAQMKHIEGPVDKHT